MPTQLREVELHRTTHLQNYLDLDHLDQQVEEIRHLGQEVSEALGTSTVWMVNSTETGGGVAEMLPRLCSLMSEVGVDTRWLVLETDEAKFFETTKGLHNLIHGVEAQAPDRKIYDAVNEEGAKALSRFADVDDVLIIHDPQPIGMGIHLDERRHRRLVWRCHIGLPFDNENTEIAWTFLEPYLKPVQRAYFSVQRYIPRMLKDRAGIITPSIDPTSHKNRPLPPYKLLGILRSAGVVEGRTPEWAQWLAQARVYSNGEWVKQPIPGALEDPLILQVSRFDRLKGFQYLIPAFVNMRDTYEQRLEGQRVNWDRATDTIQRARLILAGPDPDAVQDDPEGQAVLDELVAQVDALPGDVAARVHLMRLPMVSRKENALAVNALQRLARVVVQNSVQEGFGLTVTEAMWKGTPLVGSKVGGIGVQIRPETDGLLVDDPTDVAALAGALTSMLSTPFRAERMGRSAYRRAWDNFLVLTHARRWLAELRDLVSGQRAGNVS